MKNVLLLVHDDEGQEARLQAALDAARALEGHLTCLDVAVLPNIPDDVYGATALLLDEERTRESANRGKIEERLRREGVPWDWEDATGDPARCLTRSATLADLIVVNLDAANDPADAAIAARLLGKVETPILAVPNDTNGRNFGGQVLVAWDGSETSGRAMRAAVPLLKLAEKVIIVQIGPDGAGSAAEEAAAYLSRHDVHPVVIRAQPLEGDIGGGLLREAHDRGVDYIVMGGYGHSRLREAFFGGVTRTLLRQAVLPVFLAR